MPLPDGFEVSAMTVCQTGLVVVIAAAGWLWTAPLSREGLITAAPSRLLALDHVPNQRCLACVPDVRPRVMVVCNQDAGRVVDVGIADQSASVFCNVVLATMVAVAGGMVLVGTLTHEVHVFDLVSIGKVTTLRVHCALAFIAGTTEGYALIARRQEMRAFVDGKFTDGTVQIPKDTAAVFDVAPGKWLLQCGASAYVASKAAKTIVLPDSDDAWVHPDVAVRIGSIAHATPFGSEFVIGVTPTNALTVIPVAPLFSEVRFIAFGMYGCVYATGSPPTRVVKVFNSDSEFNDDYRASKDLSEIALECPVVRDVISVLTDAYPNLALSPAARAKCRLLAGVRSDAVRALAFTYAGVPCGAPPGPVHVTGASMATALRKLLDAFDVLHPRNWFHNDVHQSNVMLKAPDTLVLIDFGFAVFNVGFASQNESGDYVLQPDYRRIRNLCEQAMAVVNGFVTMLTYVPAHVRPWQLLVIGMVLMGNKDVANTVVTKGIGGGLQSAKLARSAMDDVMRFAKPHVTQFVEQCLTLDRGHLLRLLLAYALLADLYGAALAAATTAAVHGIPTFACKIFKCLIQNPLPHDVYSALRNLVGGTAAAFRAQAPFSPATDPASPWFDLE